MMPQNWTRGDNWLLSSIHISLWWPLLTSSPCRWSVKVSAKPSSVPVPWGSWGPDCCCCSFSIAPRLRAHSHQLPCLGPGPRPPRPRRITGGPSTSLPGTRAPKAMCSSACGGYSSLPSPALLRSSFLPWESWENRTREWGPNVVPVPRVIKSASDGTSFAWIRVTFIFRDTKSSAGVGTLLRPLTSPGGQAWHFHACSVFLSSSRARPGWTPREHGLHFCCPAESEAAPRMEGRGPGTGQLSRFQGAAPGGCAPFPMSIFCNRKHPVSWSRDPYPSSARRPVSRCPRSGESRGATLLPELLP